MTLIVRSVGLMALCLAACAATPLGTLAHFGGSAFILVPVDHVNPGEEFDVVGADLTPNAPVEFRFEREDLTVPLPGTVTPGVDGHFTARLQMPASFPSGYTTLVAEAADGTKTSTWVLVGARTSATPPPPGQPAWWADPSVVVLGVVVLGGAGVLGYTLLRRRQEQRAPVTAGARSQSSGKARRRNARRGSD